MGRGHGVGALCALLLALGAVSAHAAGPGETFAVGGLTLPSGATPAGDSGWHETAQTSVGISADGRYVVFASRLDAMSAFDDDDTAQIYGKDRVTCEVVLVSRANGFAGSPLDGAAEGPVVSHDGARVAPRTVRVCLPPPTTISSTSTCATLPPARRCSRPRTRPAASWRTTSRATARMASSPRARPWSAPPTGTTSRTFTAATFRWHLPAGVHRHERPDRRWRDRGPVGQRRRALDRVRIERHEHRGRLPTGGRTPAAMSSSATWRVPRACS